MWDDQISIPRSPLASLNLSSDERIELLALLHRELASLLVAEVSIAEHTDSTVGVMRS
jgi:hypothetical protein